MVWRIEWASAAAVEAEQQTTQYARKREGLGERFLAEIEATITRIAEGPAHFQRWPTIPPAGERWSTCSRSWCSTESTSRATQCSSCP